jgi:L-amino acid N-acyltransferase YncA
MDDSLRVSRIMTIDEQLSSLPKGLSFFDPILNHEVKEALEAGGEALISRSLEGVANGLLIYDDCEATGTIFSRSREVFDRFFAMKPSSYIFSELEAVERPREVWNIWQLDVDRAPLTHRFRHQVSIENDAREIERFMASTQPETNMKWIRVALRNGDKCFVVRVADRIVGMAWMSIVGDIARSHSVFVEPRFRRMGIMEDNLQARIIYLKSRRVHTLINEIAGSNVASSKHAEKGGETIVGRMFLYTTPEGDPAPE